MTYFQENGQPEPKSASRGAWDKIHESAPYSKKKIKSGPWRSASFRYPEEPKTTCERTLARKRRSQEKIARYQRAAAKYNYLAKHDTAKVTYKNGQEFVQVRDKGRFTGEKVVFN